MTLLSRTSYTCVSDCCFVVTLHQYTLLEGRELLLMLLCLPHAGTTEHQLSQGQGGMGTDQTGYQTSGGTGTGMTSTDTGMTGTGEQSA